MATHETPASMLKESLVEFLEAAKYCKDYRKTDESWGEFATGGCLGYPGATLMFSIIDSIGSYHRKDAKFKVTVDGKQVSINTDGWEHFKILNSDYFEQNLSEGCMKAIYGKFRSCLTHNSVLGKNTILWMDNKSNNVDRNAAFLEGEADVTKERVYIVSLAELWKICDKAVAKFKNKIDEVVPNSKQGKNFN